MSMQIRSLDVAPLNIPLFEPFGISGGAQACAENVLVTVTLDDGTRGYGEAAPFPAFNGETQAMAQTAVEEVRSIIVGADAREWRRLGRSVRESGRHVGSALCAIETAVLDALTRSQRMPLWAFFGGVQRSLETDMTITTGTVEQARSAAQAILHRDIRTIKIKLGHHTLGLDIDRISAIREVAPNAPLILDGNGGLNSDDALQLLAVLRERGIRPALFEQPVPGDDWDGMRQVTRWGDVLVAADESVASAADALRVVQEHAAHVVNIKLMKSGIAEALDIAAVCRAGGIRLMIGGMVESMLAMTMSACFAAGQGGFSFVDLDTPMFLAENPFDGGFVQTGGLLDLSDIPGGHGVTPRRS